MGLVDCLTDLKENVFGTSDDSTIARIYLRGPVVDALDDSGVGDSGYQITPGYINNRVREAIDDGAEGIIFDISSGGGEVVTGARISSAIYRIDLPTVAVIQSLGASAAYRIAVACDHVIAHPLSGVGSIGVIMSHMDISELTNRLGIKWDGVKSAEHKDHGSIFREFSETERAHLQEEVDFIHAEFVHYVAKMRDLPEATVATYANGLVYMGTKAYQYGLVDELGGVHQAIEYLEEVCEFEHTDIVEYAPEEKSFLKKKLMKLLPWKLGSSLGKHIAEGFIEAVESRQRWR